LKRDPGEIEEGSWRAESVRWNKQNTSQDIHILQFKEE